MSMKPETSKSLLSAVSAAEFVPGSPSGSPNLNARHADVARSLSPSAKAFDFGTMHAATADAEHEDTNGELLMEEAAAFEQFGSFGMPGSVGDNELIMEEGDEYFASADRSVDPSLYIPAPLQPLEYHLSSQPWPQHLRRRVQQEPHDESQIYISEVLRTRFLKRMEALWSLDAERDGVLPSTVDAYHQLHLLGRKRPDATAYKRAALGYATSLHRASHRQTGQHVLLFRIEGYRLKQESAMTALEKWRQLRHPNIVRVREAFTTSAFGDKSLCFVFDYIPGVQTFQQLLRPQKEEGKSALEPRLPESFLWKIIVQLLSALKAIHDEHLSAKFIDGESLLWRDNERAYFSGLGILDVVEYTQLSALQGNVMALQEQQQNDIRQLGQNVAHLCLRQEMEASLSGDAVLNKIGAYYSNDLRKVISAMLQHIQTPHRRVEEILSLCHLHTLEVLLEQNRYIDQLENDLQHEMTNGRLFRLICKLGFINERPEFNMDPQWSETGDRYFLKLFRDYVFHQVDGENRPVLDIGHVIQCLNKLDAGSRDKLMLMSRDEQSCLIVTYKDLSDYFDAAFKELTKRK